MFLEATPTSSKNSKSIEELQKEDPESAKEKEEHEEIDNQRRNGEHKDQIPMAIAVHSIHVKVSSIAATTMAIAAHSIPVEVSSIVATTTMAKSSSLFFFHDIDKDSTIKLEWKPSPNPFNFGNFGSMDLSKSTNDENRKDEEGGAKIRFLKDECSPPCSLNPKNDAKMVVVVRIVTAALKSGYITCKLRMEF
ncbi:PDZ domain-containing protein [Sesbania bispinosa]|nr:PDZ domain-containing protein [Sesbania bispinosa]